VAFYKGDWSNTMETLTQYIHSLDWWISIVIVGILLNITSSYLVRFLDKYIFSLIPRFRKQSKERHEQRIAEATILTKSQSSLTLLYLKEARYRTISFSSFIFGVVFTIAAKYFSSDAVFSGVAGMLGLFNLLTYGFYFIYANTLSKVLIEVERILESEESSSAHLH
jgi:hypothetical protein